MQGLLVLWRRLSPLKPDGFDKNDRLSGEAPRRIAKERLEQKGDSKRVEKE
jgi:hypothetical protein